MKILKLKTSVGKLTNTIGKLTTVFAITNTIVGLGALIGMIVVGEAGSTKTFYSCVGIFPIALFNVLLAMITGWSFKDEQTKIGKTTTASAVFNTIIGLAPLIGTMIVAESNAKPFYFCAGMFAVTSFDTLLAIMVGMSFDISE